MRPTDRDSELSALGCALNTNKQDEYNKTRRVTKIPILTFGLYVMQLFTTSYSNTEAKGHFEFNFVCYHTGD